MQIPQKTSAHKLSSNEVAALVDGLLDIENGGGGQGTAANVKPYKFGSDNLQVMGDYYGLRMINERFCRLARTVFLPFLRMQPRISSFPPEVKTFGAYSDELDNFVSLSISRIDELRSSQMITIPPEFVGLLTDAYYGGSITYFSNQRTEFTATENRVIQIITMGLNQALETAWRDLMPLHFSNTQHEENLQFATFIDSKDKVVSCSFIIQLPDADPATLDVVYPLQALKPIASQLRSRMQSDLVDDDLKWRERLQAAVMAVPLDVTAQLAQPTVPLNSLTGLTKGKIVPVDLAPRPQLLVQGKPIFDAEIGSQGGQAALSLTRKLAP